MPYTPRKVEGASETREFRRLGQALEDALTTTSGAILTVQDEGSDLAGAPHDTLNFTGAGVSASDAGGGVATVTVTPTVPGLQRKIKPSNEARSEVVDGSAPFDDADLIGFNVVSGETYKVEAILWQLQSAPTGQDLNVLWGGTATVNDMVFFNYVDVTNAVDVSPPFYQVVGGATLTAPAQTSQLLLLKGIMICSVSGTVDFMWAPNIVGAATIGFAAGSFMDFQLIEPV